MNYEGVKILDSNNNTYKRLFLEMVRISQSEKSINRRTDIDNLSVIFSQLLKWDKDLKLRRFFPIAQ